MRIEIVMLSRITISIVSIALTAGCTDPEEKPIPFEQPITQSAETPKKSTEKSFLDRPDESIDYREKYTAVPPEDSRWIEFGIFRSKRPATWFWVAPSSSFVLCNYVVPGVEKSELAMFAITQFDDGQGGNLEMNLKRWKSKFNTFEGAPVRPNTRTILVNGTESTVVELRGEYMGAGASWHKPDQTLLVVILVSDSSTYYFKLLGPTKTIDAHRDSFFTFLANIKLLDP